MPVIIRHRGYRVLFFSNEGQPREPIHVHVRKGEKIAKFWVEPEVALAESYKITSPELSKIARLIQENREFIIRSWHEHFGQ